MESSSRSRRCKLPGVAKARPQQQRPPRRLARSARAERLSPSGQALLEESKRGCRESVHVRHPVARSSLQGLDSLDPPSHGDACMTGGIAVSIPSRARCTGFSDAPIGTEPIACNPRADQCMLFGARPYSPKELIVKVAECMPGLARVEDDPADAVCRYVGNPETRRADQ